MRREQPAGVPHEAVARGNRHGTGEASNPHYAEVSERHGNRGSHNGLSNHKTVNGRWSRAVGHGRDEKIAPLRNASVHGHSRRHGMDAPGSGRGHYDRCAERGHSRPHEKDGHCAAHGHSRPHGKDGHCEAHGHSRPHGMDAPGSGRGHDAQGGHYDRCAERGHHERDARHAGRSPCEVHGPDGGRARNAHRVLSVRYLPQRAWNRDAFWSLDRRCVCWVGATKEPVSFRAWQGETFC